ncbi:MAG: hypothetical protein KDE32_09985 [Novosphingobium sp.]|nr:hypothetical protein [Novosphingobium sp.]
MSYGLTPRQADMLRFIVGHQRAHGGKSPCLRECADGVGIRHRSGAHRTLQELERRGAIRRLPGRERAIEVLNPISIPSIEGEPLHAVPGPWDVRP